MEESVSHFAKQREKYKNEARMVSRKEEKRSLGKIDDLSLHRTNQQLMQKEEEPIKTKPFAINESRRFKSKSVIDLQ